MLHTILIRIHPLYQEVEDTDVQLKYKISDINKKMI